MKLFFPKIARPRLLVCLASLLFFSVGVITVDAQIPGGTLDPGLVAK